MKKSKLMKLAAMTAAFAMCVTGCGQKGQEAKPELNQPQEQGQTETGSSTTESQPADTSGSGDYVASEPVSAEGTLSVIASPGAHTQILEQAAQILQNEGITLYIESDFDDYMVPNWFVDGGVYDCNYFQHEDYLNTFNEEQNTHLVSVGKIHFEPLGIYPGKKVSLADLAEGDTISIPRDTSNQARALQLLSQAGVISVDENKQFNASITDITSNPKNIKVELMDASQVPSAVASSAFVVMNGNFARQALYTVTTDALFYENANSAIAEKYANIIAVKDGNQNDPKVQRLVQVLQSDEIRNYINNSYSGAVVAYTGN